VGECKPLGSGEIDVEEMEQMQMLIGDFGEVLIKVGRCTFTSQTTQSSSLNPVNLPNFRH
jgi:hypothetical protein